MQDNIVFDPHLLRVQRLTGGMSAALDELTAAGVLKADPARTAAAATAAARRKDAARAVSLRDNHLADYQLAMRNGALEDAAAAYSAYTAADHVAKAAANQDHTRASSGAVLETTLAAVQRALPTIREEYNAAATDFTAAFRALGGSQFTLADVLRTGQSDDWADLQTAAARLTTCATLLDGMVELDAGEKADLIDLVAATTRGTVDANAHKAALGQPWLQDKDFTHVARWLAVLTATPRAGYHTPEIYAGDAEAVATEARLLRDAVQWLVNTGGAVNFQDRVDRLTRDYWKTPVKA